MYSEWGNLKELEYNFDVSEYYKLDIDLHVAFLNVLHCKNTYPNHKEGTLLLPPQRKQIG